uniref:Gag-pol polyprotein n=1 Tax=Solanum tuberosum TaxID=4113 RepID=M1DM45_SOLTU
MFHYQYLMFHFQLCCIVRILVGIRLNTEWTRVQVLSIQIACRSVPNPYSSLLVIMPPRRAYARNINAYNTKVSPPVLDHEISNVEFQNVIQLFAQSVANQNNEQVPVPVNASGGSVAARVRDFC